MKKSIYMFFITVAIAIVGVLGNVNAAEKFPSTITPSRGGLLGRNEGWGWNLYKKEFTSTNPQASGKALCTAYRKYAPTGGSCSQMTWSNNASDTALNDKVSVAIGAVINKARENTEAINSWENFYYSEFAINQFLYEGYTNNLGYGTYYNNLIGIPSTVTDNSKYKSYLAAAKYDFANFKNTNVSISSTKYNRDTHTATAIVTCTDYKKAKIACNLANKTATAKVNGTNVSGVTVTATKNSDQKSYTLTATIPEANLAQVESSIRETNPDAAIVLKVTFNVSDKKCWNKAQRYNCGDNYQPLAPDILDPVCDTKSKSSTVTDTSFILEVHKIDADIAAGAENRFIDGATVLVTYKQNEQSEERNLFEEDDGYVELVDGKFDVSVADAGIYCVKEVRAPKGYKLNSNSKCVTIDAENPTGLIEIENKKDNSNLTINKVDENGKPVIGAKIRVYDTDARDVVNAEEGEEVPKESIIADFTTDGNPKVIEGLAVGKTYTVYEYELPKDGGFAGGLTSVNITISDDESQNVVTLTNTHSSFKISKQSITSTKELPGAQLIITDAQGNEVARWTSTDEPREITGKADGDYTLTELTAPQGYTIAESINFTIENGKIKGDDDNMLVMKDGTVVDVPDTFTFQNIITMFIGLLLVGLGSGVLFYETKKKKKA